MTTSNERRRRHVLASLVPTKAHRAPNDFSQTDYEVPSVLALQRNQTPEEIVREYPLVQHEDSLATRSSRQATVQMMDMKIHEAQQQWLAHQEEQFETQVENALSLDVPKQTSPQGPSTTRDECGLTTPNHHTPRRALQQLDHIERLFHTAGESLPTSRGASDCLVATQCYTMALEQLTAMIKILENDTR